jgi:hypothetical protein
MASCKLSTSDDSLPVSRPQNRQKLKQPSGFRMTVERCRWFTNTSRAQERQTQFVLALSGSLQEKAPNRNHVLRFFGLLKTMLIGLARPLRQRLKEDEQLSRSETTIISVSYCTIAR